VNDILLHVENLKTSFYTDEGVVKAVDGVSFSIKKNMTLGIVGESGCGKSVTALSILRLLPGIAQIDEGHITYQTKDAETINIESLDPRSKTMRQIRGGEISMIFQDPMTSLNPVYSIGFQIIENIVYHFATNKKKASMDAIGMLTKVGIANAKERVKEFPHQFSGGMRQRSMIAMALACNPNLLIADEPTTALDVTIQAQVLNLIRSLKNQYEMSVMLITHDMGVVAEMADDVIVMYMGKIVESATVADLFSHPKHPYTQKLLQSIPVLGRAKDQTIRPIQGSTPNPLKLPQGCSFGPRCDHYWGKCQETPPLFSVGHDHKAACWLHAEGYTDAQ
jgi:oligopeptide/dipeptide ABC transporter ATP-binding protein